MSLIVKKARFIKSITGGDGIFNADLPEIAIAGKSNVGKSSLINYLANNGSLARTSKQPGKTRLINYFLINDSFYLVDLPGYGYARVSADMKAGWGDMMNSYFASSPMLKALLILADIRHDPTADDRAMVLYAETYHIPYIVAATKADKLAKTRRRPAAQKLSMNIGATIPPKVVSVSSELKLGGDELLSMMEEYIR